MLLYNINLNFQIKKIENQEKIKSNSTIIKYYNHFTKKLKI